MSRTLKKVMKDKEDHWDEYIEGALFAINTNQSTTTKYSPFYLMFGRNPRFPFEVEKSSIAPSGSDDISQLMQDLSSEVVIRAHVEEISRMKDALFPVVDSNIQKAQEKQKIQYQNKKGLPVCQFKAGDDVLLRNMLQKTKKGHKLEDQWLGPYTVTEVIADKGVCKLFNPSTKKQVKQQSIKNLRPYKANQSNVKQPEASQSTVKAHSSSHVHRSRPDDSSVVRIEPDQMQSNADRSNVKQPEANQSTVKVKSSLNIHHSRPDDSFIIGIEPDDRMQSNVDQSSVKKPDDNQSTVKAYLSSHVNRSRPDDSSVVRIESDQMQSTADRSNVKQPEANQSTVKVKSSLNIHHSRPDDSFIIGIEPDDRMQSNVDQSSVKKPDDNQSTVKAYLSSHVNRSRPDDSSIVRIESDQMQSTADRSNVKQPEANQSTVKVKSSLNIHHSRPDDSFIIGIEPDDRMQSNVDQSSVKQPDDNQSTVKAYLSSHVNRSRPDDSSIVRIESDQMQSNADRSNVKQPEANQSTVKVKSSLNIHHSRPDDSFIIGIEPDDRMQSNVDQSSVKQPDDNQSTVKAHPSSNVNVSYIEPPKNNNHPDLLCYLQQQQIGETANSIQDEKLAGDKTSTPFEDSHAADGLSPKACEEFDKKVRNMKELDILQQLFTIKDELHSKLKSHEKCWRSEVFSSGYSKEAPDIKKKDLSVNVHSGGFTEDQLMLILNELKVWFPAAGVDFLTTVILPEALIILCKVLFEISYCEAEYYLTHGGQYLAEEVLQSFEIILKKRASKRAKLTKTKIPAKKSKPNRTHITHTKEDECIFVKEKKSNASSKSMAKKPNYPVKATKEDEDVIMKNHWLTDVQIGKAQNLLKQQFPHMQGLQATTLGPLQQFDVMRSKFVQILHTGAKHWICISNTYCSQMNSIKIYDSMYLGVNAITKKQISSILHIESADAIKIMVEPVTQQMNGSDCGVFAIAFAAALCYGQDPSKMIFQIRNIRSYLWNCLTNGHIDMFPSAQRMSDVPNSKSILLPIYCKCRLPYIKQEDDMVECSSCHKWYHRKCLKVPKMVFKRKDMNWKCSQECNVKN